MSSNTITSDILLALLGLFIPPLPVAFKKGVFSLDTLLNVILTLLGGIPGVLHCWFVIVKYPGDGIPFIENRRNNQYQIVPDEENGSPQPPSQVSNYQSTRNEDENVGEGGSSSKPPAYSEVLQSGGPAKGDNKVQYHN